MNLKRRPTGKTHDCVHDVIIPNVTSLLIPSEHPEIVSDKFKPFGSNFEGQNHEWVIEYSVNQWKQILDYWITINVYSIKTNDIVRAICTAYIIDNKENSVFIGRRGGYFKDMSSWQVTRFLKKNSDDEKKFIVDNSIRLCIHLSIILDDLTPLPGLRMIKTDCSLDSPKNFSLLYNSRFTDGDTEIVIKDQKFKLHSNVLKYRCSQLLNNLEDKNNNSLIFNVDPEVVEKLIEFIYLDQLNNIDNYIEPLIKLANYYELNKLKRICEICLAENFLTVQNVEEIQTLAKNVNATELYIYTVSFKSANKNPFQSAESDEHAIIWRQVQTKFAERKACLKK